MLRILVPLDSSPASEAAMADALAIANAFVAQIHLVRVLDTHPTSKEPQPGSCMEWRLLRENAKRYLQNIRQRLPKQHRNKIVRTDILEGNAAAELLRYCDESNIDLIVMSTFGESGGQPFPHGGVTLKLLSSTSASMLLVQPNTDLSVNLSIGTGWNDAYENVLVALDASSASTAALQLAVAIAQAHDAKITIADCVTPICIPPRISGDTQAIKLAANLQRLLLDRSRQYLQESKAQLPSHLTVETCTISAREPFDNLTALTQRNKIDLFVAARSFAHGRIELVQNRRVFASLGCPVLVLNNGHNEKTLSHYRSILLPQSETKRLRAG